jgi:hypothetical protein
VNYWGYSTIAFFAPKGSYSASGSLGEQVTEFKTLVKELHKAGIEVILDVVFNHTGEGNELGYTYSFRGLDNQIYYMLDENPRYYKNYSGCGNTLNCNHPLVRNLIMDSLHYWVMEMHVERKDHGESPHAGNNCGGSCTPEYQDHCGSVGCRRCVSGGKLSRRTVGGVERSV